MKLTNVEKEIAIKILRKYLRKGNLAMAMRDYLPHSNLSLNRRSAVAKIMHKIVRYKRLYLYLLKNEGLEVTAENLLSIALGEKKIKIGKIPYCVKYSYSDFLCKILDPDNIVYLNIEPKNYIAVNLRRISRKDALKILTEEGYSGKIVDSVESGIEITPEGRYSRLIKDGFAHVQDISSQIISKYIAKLGNRIMDYCAGSGGKTLTMAYFNKNAEIYAYDISKKKREILKNRAKFYKLNIKVLDYPKGKFDVVLVDAPCSGVGAARRNPDAKYVGKKDVDIYAKNQLKILLEASKLTTKYLVYVVCTLTPQETDNVVKNFLQLVSSDFEIVMPPIIERKTMYGGFVRAHDILYISVLKSEGTYHGVVKEVRDSKIFI